jgi:hypothetical protein
MDGLDDAVNQLNEPEDLVIAVARAYFHLLEQPEARPFHDELIEVRIFNTIFKDERNPRVESHQVFPNSTDRQKYASILKAADLKRAAELRKWL